jgi:hypothetical protein
MTVCETRTYTLHVGKMGEDAGRRAHWASVFASKDFVE